MYNSTAIIRPTVEAYTSTEQALTANVVTGCTFYPRNGFAVKINSSSGNTVSGNVITETTGSGFTTGIVLVSASRNAVNGNAISGYGTTGISLDSSSSNNNLLGNAINPTNITTPISNSGTYNATVDDQHMPGVTLISEHTCSSDGSSFTFSNIPAIYRDLRIVIRGRGTAAGTSAQIHVQFNADGGANYDQSQIMFNNATADSSVTLGTTYIFAGWLEGNTAVSGNAALTEMLIGDYRGTTYHKAILSASGVKLDQTTANNTYQARFAGWWRNTAAITSVVLSLDSGNFADNTVISLYGLM